MSAFAIHASFPSLRTMSTAASTEVYRTANGGRTKGPAVWPRETSRATATVAAERRERADSRLRGRATVTGPRYPSANPTTGTGPGPAGGDPAEGRGADERSRVSEAPPAASPPPPPPPLPPSEAGCPASHRGGQETAGCVPPHRVQRCSYRQAARVHDRAL